jgi:hypothetical protein
VNEFLKIMYPYLRIYKRKTYPHDNGCPMFGLVYRPALGIDINIKNHFKPILPQVIPMGENIVWWTNFGKCKVHT